MQRQVCILGALTYSWMSRLVSTRQDEAAIERVIREQYGFTSGGIAEWNDLPTTTFEDVERVLEKALLERLG